jgi:hypothetical protein
VVADLTSITSDTWAKRFNAYGALIVTIIIFGLFGWHPTDDTMKALAMLAGGYWLGSSNSSQKKDDTTAALGAALATSTPAPPAPLPPATSQDTADAAAAAEALRLKTAAP